MGENVNEVLATHVDKTGHIRTPVNKRKVTPKPQFEYIEKPVYDFFKRLFDIVFSSAVLILLSPLYLIIAVLIKIDDRGPLFYKQYRIGRGGKPFSIYKFRTMIVDADKFDMLLTAEQLEEYKKDYKIHDDPRITKIGKFLRAYSCDELPQFLNVLIGNMSIIGPRPVLDEETDFFQPYRSVLLSVKPGITGNWQTNGRSNVTYEDFARQNLELKYVANRSLFLDAKIFFRTFSVWVRRTGA
jgi:lipopolysaccharide/colanic/teichoic acid biosynthesis glycosyltransferase